MKYRDLVQPGERLETVKQIRDGSGYKQARRDVETFVISERMAGILCSVVFPNLQFDEPRDQKALLAVANYGTGKTHLMSVLAALAEFEDLVGCVTREDVRRAAEPVAGRFAAIRFDIGVSEMSLRNIVCAELERGLKARGVEFRFPAADRATNTKDALADMMAAFEAVHPAKGLLFVLDEMLDFLRARRDAELIQDLSFLREVGEFCRASRFRFISGIQEAIFDNPRFRGVADAVRRVRDRFEQVRIAREDVAFVVEERLLRKRADQREAIRDHLQRFTPLYERMAERMDRFVALFPVHPDYLRTFEQVSVVEKRQVLRTIQQEMDRLADVELPADAPGLICFDTYRSRLADDPSFRTIPEVQEVLDKSQVLRTKVAHAMPDRQYVDTALRIIDGLSVHRLTTDDIHVPIGMTPEMLRDELCLLPPGLPKLDALFLRTTVESIVAKIQRAVSGQFLSVDATNGQIYLDVRKDIDYDQRIQERADSLDRGALDEAYYLAMEEVLLLRDDPYVSGFRIWLYELPWAARNADRAGYLFMGAPNERSTAQPPRDFYVYFLQPYDKPKFEDERKADEVFIRLTDPGEEFTQELRRYAGARALAKESTATHRPVYDEKTRRAHQALVSWLRTHMGRAMSVTYRGEAKPLSVWLASARGPRSTVREQVDTVAAAILEGHFSARYPGYPEFGVRVTRENLEATARTALVQIATQRSTTAGTKVLESLELMRLDEAGVRDGGRYAKALLASLAAADGRLVNRADILVQRDREVWSWPSWHLEPVWLVVVAAALCQIGKLEIGVDGTRIDALGLERLARYSLEQLSSFDYLAAPRALPLAQLRGLARLLGVAEGAITERGAEEAQVRELLTQANNLLRRTNDALAALANHLQFWGEQLFDLPEERGERLAALKSLLEDVRNRNSPGKMNSFDPGPAGLVAAQAGKSELDHVEEVLAARDRLASTADYLREAAQVFGSAIGESTDAEALRADMLALLRGPGPIDPARVVSLHRAGDELKERFVALAARSYRHDHLDAAGDARKAAMVRSERYVALQRLSSVSLLPAGRFGSLERQLVGLPSLLAFDERQLSERVEYPGLTYRPRLPDGPSALARLEDCERQVQSLYEEWVAALLDSLTEPEMIEQVTLLEPTPRREMEAFVASRRLPSPLSTEFVRALDQVFRRFEVRHLAAAEVWHALFPDAAPATVEVLRTRFTTFLDEQVGTSPPERVRLLPGRVTNSE